ncbi:hypothetical protein [Mycobacterium sp. E3198]|uniref:hypothetical protein n=1 Tax=Mycobacterium sp. E3198 TaxID=1834143 RepID=UPI000801DE3C|nr:hypothetical protein [Mycobacterium sp. E3198]OBG35061.1 hypothetical protein A5673_20910 [Mycobacterium sp. E3198]
MTESRWRNGLSIGDPAGRLARTSGLALLRVARVALLVVAVALIACLAVFASHYQRRWPRWMVWLAQGGDWVPVVLVSAVIALLCIVTYLLRRNRSSVAVPVMIVVGLTVTSLVLGLNSFWRCTNRDHPTLIGPLLWTVSLVKGGIGDESLDGAGCPKPTPAALEVARLTIVAAIFISLVGVAAAAFRAQSDRLRAGWARWVTVVVDVDDESASMVGPISRTLRSGSALVLMTDNAEQACVAESRRLGARIVQVSFDRLETLVTQRFWRRLSGLYLLSADPSSNLLRLSVISNRLAPVATKRRIPLIVRIDDPWLAEAWRAQKYGQHGGDSDHLWAADTVSKYEATARRLIEEILRNKSVRRIIVCGTSQLTLALCAEMAQRHAERCFHAAEGEPGLPALTLVAPDADEYVRDHEERHKRKGFASAPPPIDRVAAMPSAAAVGGVLGQTDGADSVNAVIVVDSAAAADPILGTRLAAGHPTMPIYMYDPAARIDAERVPVACELRTYRLGMALSDGQAHDNFERAAMLTHERYAASQEDRTKPSAQPWETLSDFYKGSNRRQLRNALWMVEKIAGHTWNAGDVRHDDVSPESLQELDAVIHGETSRAADPATAAVETLQRLGFDQGAIDALAQAEWERWSRYMRERGWTWGPARSVKNKQDERLVESWEATLADPRLKGAALKSLADAEIALAKLKRLGFTEDAAYAMAQAEWEDWSRYLRSYGWSQGDERDESNKLHEKLVDDWEATVADPELKAAALKSLAGTLIELTNLGYRSRPMWKTYERVGTVTAKRHRRQWKCTTASGEPILASAGDWEVCDDGHSWPVRDDIFRASYRRIPGDRWERRGAVLARPARAGETVYTLDGPVIAGDDDIVVQGDRGEEWPVPSEEFRRRYRGPVPVYKGPEFATARAAEPAGA